MHYEICLTFDMFLAYADEGGRVLVTVQAEFLKGTTWQEIIAPALQKNGALY
jgi:hypothetical protein